MRAAPARDDRITGLDDQCEPYGATTVAVIVDLGGHIAELSLCPAATLRRNRDSVKH
ncbi:hypothetical protein AAFO92_00940 [Roseovarius sp. CAU 1744]